MENGFNDYWEFGKCWKYWMMYFIVGYSMCHPDTIMVILVYGYCVFHPFHTWIVGRWSSSATHWDVKGSMTSSHPYPPLLRLEMSRVVWQVPLPIPLFYALGHQGQYDTFPFPCVYGWLVYIHLAYKFRHDFFYVKDLYCWYLGWFHGFKFWNLIFIWKY